MAQKRMAFVLTHFPSTPPKGPGYQGAVPGIPSVMGGSLMLGIGVSSCLKACSNVSEEIRKP